MGDFAEELITTIRERRSFGGHPLWRRIAAGEVSREGLRIFAAQFFLQVRAFPRAVSALHSRCPWPEERRELAESLYEEETGLISGCGRPHPELFPVGVDQQAVGDMRSTLSGCNRFLRPSHADKQSSH